VGLDITDSVTTSDFHTCASADIALAVGDSDDPSDFSLEQCYDADGVPSTEIICDNCRGVGHPRRLCPSPRRFRTFDFAIALLRSAKERAESRAQRDGRPAGGRRPPPRGQRPPFRPRGRPEQPRRFNAPAAARQTQVEADRQEPEETADLLTFTDELFYEPPDTSAAQESGSLAEAVAPGPVSAPSQVNAFAGSVRAVSTASSLLQSARATARSWLLTLLAAALMLVRFVQRSLTLRVALFVGSVAAVANVVAAPTVEHLGMLVGRATLPGVVACVDSGATVTCISERLALSGEVDFRVENRNPLRRLRVASDQLLDIVAIGQLSFANVQGYTIADGLKTPGNSNVVLHNVAAVRGLSERVILLSVKSLKKHDGIKVYFNSDNPWGVEDCLRLPCGLFLPFTEGTHDLPVPRGGGVSSPDSAHIALRDSPWDVSLRIHAALCHAGATRVSMSNVTYNGRKLPTMPPPEGSSIR